jgi:hypothetical protein
MAKKSALTLSKVDDTYVIEHRGYPVGGMLRFHAILGVAAALMTVPLAVELSPRVSQVYFVVTALLIAYAAVGYLIYIPFASLGGRLSFRPTDENISFSKRVMGKDTQSSREIPWEGKLETEVEQVGMKVKFLPLSFYRVKVVTDFMTYHVATFGPGLDATADDLAKAVKKARYGRSKAIDFDALKGT